jgi:hypothetical protein
VTAITICQPYAALICLPESHPQHKRVENRTWLPPKARIGEQIAIHAGKSKAWLHTGTAYELPVAALRFGAIVAVATLAGTFRVEAGDAGPVIPAGALEWWPWLAGHPHAEGPVCWVLQDVRPLREPVDCAGARGLWQVPSAVLTAVLGDVVRQRDAASQV